jgi:hypothetical protein
MASKTLVDLINDARNALESIERHLRQSNEQPSMQGATKTDLEHAMREARRWVQELLELAAKTGTLIKATAVAMPTRTPPVTYSELTHGHPAFEDAQGNRYYLDPSGSPHRLPKP